MRFATIRTADGTTAARFDGDTLTPLDAPDVGALLAAEGGPGGVAARVGAAPVLVAEADFAPVVPSPSKVICVGLNYRTHIQETGRELPEYPTLFAKFAETLMGPYDDLALPVVSNRVDWEAELGLIIGRPVYRADAAEAEDGFGDDGAAGQGADVDAELGDDGGERGADAVPVDDAAFGQAFGAGGADVVFAEDVEQGAAGQPGVGGGGDGGDGDGGRRWALAV